jgi:CelD/BcsL family acetyltransferase involved in cellulose biosynthesis
VSERFLASGRVHISALLVGDQIVAAHWGLVCRDRFYYLMPSYEGGEWMKFSPGRLLMEELIEWCFSQGIAEFDLGVGDEPYKAKLVDTVVPLSRVRIPMTYRGRLYLSLLASRSAIQAKRQDRAKNA